MPNPVSAPLRAPSEYGFPVDLAKLLPWGFAEERLTAARDYWLVTVHPAGRPHVAPLWGVWVDNAWWFTGNPDTRWGKNLARNPAATVHLEDGRQVVIVDGTVGYDTVDPETAARILAGWNPKYGEFAPDPANAPIYCLRPTTARGWSTENGSDATRWVFAGHTAG